MTWRAGLLALNAQCKYLAVIGIDAMLIKNVQQHLLNIVNVAFFSSVGRVRIDMHPDVTLESFGLLRQQLLRREFLIFPAPLAQYLAAPGNRVVSVYSRRPGQLNHTDTGCV
tara:strand:- start:2370 stop:2705 length:336 start_codon:yes stop_codon:yes gene_type:complete